MQVSVETTGGLERRMTVEVPEDRIDGEVQSRLQRLARTAKIKGFRPGKVPMKVVAKQYGRQVRDEVVGEVIQATYFEAINQEKLQPAGMPTIEPKVNEPGKSLQYTAIIEVMPEVELADLSGAKLEKVVAEVSDEDLEKMIDNLRQQRAEWKSVESKAKEGDRLNIDFKGTIDGEEFSGGSSENVPVTLGSGRMIEGFEDGLVGAKAGDELTLDLKFPEDYGHKEVAGKPVQFAVKVNSVEEPLLPEVDEEFAKGFGIGDGSLEALRNEVRQNMERELQQAVTAKNKQAVMDALLEMNKIEVPTALVDNEAETLKQQMMQQMQVPQGKSMPDLDASLFKSEAERRVTLGMLVAEIIQANELKVDEEKIKAKVAEIASTYEQPQDVINWYMADRSRLAQVENLLLEDEVVDWVLDKADVSESKSSFDEVMGRG
ncbi:MAG: trigger factor [Gammaproteobacteria bacterium]|nr:trigger factor [Gammaproteobacteria bacterium]MCW8840901.1 trigger factor [Gammaproteobacteria bacterium]MCW8928155.1 trigger factor [Gammaproteobacteria bacterium]MCW8958205.1 trigger factor [Gammaproteobacteria bacterium]MCW8972196.1 trigger factor [Gammaproteobacteria bacterium]